MKLALIPPRGLEHFALRSDIHMILPIDACLDTAAGVRIRRDMRDRGDYIIMDNGAAEDHPLQAEELGLTASKVFAKEVVLPDLMGSASATMEMVASFLTLSSYTAHSFVAMAVVHGTDMKQALEVVEFYSKRPEIKVLGLPRLLAQTTQCSAIRLDLANEIEKRFEGRFKIHLLGAIPNWISELKYVGRYAPFIRSMDTSAPFNYWLAGKSVEDLRAKVARPAEYLTKNHPPTNRPLLEANVATMLRWASGA